MSVAESEEVTKATRYSGGMVKSDNLGDKIKCLQKQGEALQRGIGEVAEAYEKDKEEMKEKERLLESREMNLDQEWRELETTRMSVIEEDQRVTMEEEEVKREREKVERGRKVLDIKRAAVESREKDLESREKAFKRKNER